MKQNLIKKQQKISRRSEEHFIKKKNYSHHSSQKKKYSQILSKSQIEVGYLKRPIVKSSTILGEVVSTEIYYDVKIDAKIKKQVKTILHQQKGMIHPQSFTAILGPSGSGKTTLLNFLSSRLMTTNLIIQGQLQINSVPIVSLEPYSDQIVYVMQDDALMPMLTPRQCFMFAANLTLNLPHQKKILRVQELIKDLGLTACSDIRIGAAGSKGLSGGQRKRVSIGVQLITNPGIIFLDEPTTGLDSTTALQVILLLKRLSQQGRAVVSTIHQPSSQIFEQFDRLMLLCDGHCIYQGLANEASHHFSNIGFQLPKLVNPAQFYLNLMSFQMDQQSSNQNYQAAKKKFNQKIQKCEEQFNRSQFYIFQKDKNLQPLEIYKKNEVSTFYELYILMIRAFYSVIRNPLDVGYKIIQAILTAIVAAIIFGKMDDQQLQNVKGLNFFFVTTSVMYGVNGTLATFSSERPIFLRQRYSKIYSTWTYFISRTFMNVPFEILYATIFLSILYFWTSFGTTTFDQFLKFVLSINATYFYAVSVGLLYSAAIPKLEHAMATIPIIIIPMNLLSGFFLNLDNYNDIRVIFYPLVYLSPFKYGYQAGMIILKDFFPSFSNDFNFKPNTYELNILVLFGLAVVFRILACIIMIIRSNPKRPKVKKNNKQPIHNSITSNKAKQPTSRKSLMTSQKLKESQQGQK